MSASNRIFSIAFRKISSIADRIKDLPKTIVDQANILFDQVHKGKLVKVRSNYVKAATCLYIACRQGGVSLPFNVFCPISCLDKKKIGQCFNQIREALGTSVVPITTTDFVSSYCSQLGLPNAVATHIARKAEELKIVQKCSPMLIASTAVYMASQASNNRKTYKDIGKYSGVSEPAMKKLQNQMSIYTIELFPIE